VKYDELKKGIRIRVVRGHEGGYGGREG